MLSQLEENLDEPIFTFSINFNIASRDDSGAVRIPAANRANIPGGSEGVASSNPLEVDRDTPPLHRTGVRAPSLRSSYAAKPPPVKMGGRMTMAAAACRLEHRRLGSRA